MAWSAVTNPEIDPESPGTTGLFGKYRDNDEAMYDGWAMVIKSANELEAGLALQNDDELVFAVAANGIWQFEMVLLITTSHAVADFQFDFTFPVGTTYMITHDAREGNAPLLSGYTTEASGATTFNYAAAATAEPAFFHGWIDTAGAAGNFQLQWGNVGLNDATVLAGSYLVAHQDYSTI